MSHKTVRRNSAVIVASAHCPLLPPGAQATRFAQPTSIPTKAQR